MDSGFGRCSRGSVYPRCGCRDEQDHQLGSECPELGQPGHGSWSFEVRIPGPARRHRVRRGGFATEYHARQALSAFRAQEAEVQVSGAWTTGRWLQEWLATHRALRASTRRSHSGHIRMYLNPALGRIPLVELTTRDVQNMLDAVIESPSTSEPAVRSGRPRSSGSTPRYGRG
jgi:hypothetical protein